jgi:4-amino-4-deoxy-L-arabinose transferase-like glycosyltransferase
VTRILALSAGLALAGLAIRVHNALSYPPDWGFDARYSWQYIYSLTRSWALPPPSAGWATSDPPLFYYASAAVMRGLSAAGARDAVVYALPLLSLLEGLAIVALAVALARREARSDPLRAPLAGLLLLFLPAHLHMSAMVNEEMLAALLTSLAVFGLAVPERRRIGRALAVGLASGLALLTKLTGAVAVATAALTYAADGWRPDRRAQAAACAGAALGVALLAGGWFPARSLLATGSAQPVGLPAHVGMLSLPPGERGLVDYLRVPLATFRDPQLLNPDLLHSVWGSTFVTVWFDGHRYFLPRESRAVTTLGSVTLLLALLPTAAFAVGLARGCARLRRGGSPADLPLLLLTALTLAGYAFYTWRNPWYAVVKGTTLLGLCLPFSFYASETLSRWLQGRHRAWLAAALLALAFCVALSCTFDLVFQKTEVSGLPWPPAEGG